ncbi:MAG: plasmid stabilization protein [Aestuariivirga sp.]
MVALTIRNIDPDLKRQIKQLAASHDRSMEAEAHELLKRAAFANNSQKNIGRSIRERVARLGGIDLDIPPRTEMMREPPNFEE